MNTRRTKKKVKNVTFKDQLEETTKPTQEQESFSCPFCSRHYIRRCFFEKHVASCKTDLDMDIPSPKKKVPHPSPKIKPLRCSRGSIVVFFIVLAGVFFLIDKIFIFLTTADEFKMLETDSDLICSLHP